jgi:hypothetical protein
MMTSRCTSRAQGTWWLQSVWVIAVVDMTLGGWQAVEATELRLSFRDQTGQAVQLSTAVLVLVPSTTQGASPRLPLKLGASSLTIPLDELWLRAPGQPLPVSRRRSGFLGVSGSL